MRRQLYNQVRNITALLFLIGARIEPPSVISSLLWTSDATDHTKSMQSSLPERPFVEGKPGFEMADDLPLILWQCGFTSQELSWRIDSEPREGDIQHVVQLGQVERTFTYNLDPVQVFTRDYLSMHERWTRQRLKAVILKHHLTALASHIPVLPPPSLLPPPPTPVPTPKGTKLPIIMSYHGAGRISKATNYVPILQRRRTESPDVVNARWAVGRGQEKMQKRADGKVEADRVREINLKKKEVVRKGWEEEKERERRENEGVGTS
jgi:tRNA pseudouridine38/39 synthase